MIAVFMATAARSIQRDTPLRVSILVYEGCSAFVATGLSEALELAVLLESQKHARNKPLLQVGWQAAHGGAVAVSPRVTIRADTTSSTHGPHVLIVPPLFHTSPDDFASRLSGLDSAVRLVRRHVEQGGVVASACSGAGVLAAAGALEGRSATGCWWLESVLRSRFPNVRWQMTETLVRDGDVLTAGAGLAYTRLVFELLERSGGRDLALLTARFLGIERNGESRQPFAQLLPLQHSEDAMVGAFERHVRAHAASRELHIDQISRALNVSTRTLFRRVRAVTGESPFRIIQLTRLEKAKSLLADTQLSVDDICERCGWEDAASFRKLFSREIGMSPTGWREAFGLRAGRVNTVSARTRSRRSA
ncbi:MAG: helix-turn-helix domain-containing protein [Ramlibacter sp.]|nr:helix-turn-helix domain-containing protein [Ramlibacter sp.]